MADLSSYVNRAVEGVDADVETWLGTPTAANLRTALSPDTTGTGDIVFAVSPAFTGTPTSPTASTGTSTTQIATTAFVQNEIAQVTESPEFFILTVGSEDIGLTTGTAKFTFRTPYACTLESVKATVTSAPTGSSVIVDINENGSTVLSTKLSIDASETTSTSASSQAVISDSSLANDAEITIDIDQVGSVSPGVGLKVYMEMLEV